jgi:hypothetical protein
MTGTDTFATDGMAISTSLHAIVRPAAIATTDPPALTSDPGEQLSWRYVEFFAADTTATCTPAAAPAVRGPEQR